MVEILPSKDSIVVLFRYSFIVFLSLIKVTWPVEAIRPEPLSIFEPCVWNEIWTPEVKEFEG